MPVIYLSYTGGINRRIVVPSQPEKKSKTIYKKTT
jgi:hypothetical protein